MGAGPISPEESRSARFAPFPLEFGSRLGPAAGAGRHGQASAHAWGPAAMPATSELVRAQGPPFPC